MYKKYIYIKEIIYLNYNYIKLYQIYKKNTLKN